MTARIRAVPRPRGRALSVGLLTALLLAGAARDGETPEIRPGWSLPGRCEHAAAHAAPAAAPAAPELGCHAPRREVDERGTGW